MQIVETSQTTEDRTESRLSRLQRLIQIYETGQVSELMDRVVDKVLAQEEAETRVAIQRLDDDIENYAGQYGMPSDNFYEQFRAGKLGDTMDFVEWSSLIQMREDLRQRLAVLAGNA